ncbi:invasin domain 3-containing protein [Paenibacillus guangzhouensis]|uniref:invasin domain 3-containing protein n=1 Tax=Paenibacillus guangzhouensis TaxID=1473112 RepID=UPI00187B3D8C|nr:invasin domain 3-containing protein [Paenibacillus guangzhouensis]
MKDWVRKKRWIAIMLILFVAGTASTPPVRGVVAAGAEVLDQEQANGVGNVWVNRDSPRYQTFTPAIAGNLSRVEVSIFDSFGVPGSVGVSLYEEGNLSTPIATAQQAYYGGGGWISVDFSGTSPYLKKEKMYRMVLSTEFGGSNGFGWYLSSSDVYSRGYSAAFGRDFTFRTYMIPDYSLSPAMSEVASADTSLVANGTSQTDITVKLKDAQGQAWPSGGEIVTLTTTLGTLGAVRDNGDGTYTAQLTAPTTLGTATISATVGGQAAASKASVQLVAGAPSAALSTVDVGSGTLTADGTSQTPITVKLKDAQGHALTSGGATVSIATTLGTLGDVKDNGNGTYTAQLTAPTTLGTATISATVGGQAIASKASVEFVVGSPSVVLSTVEANSGSLTADGASKTLITVKLIDAQGHALTSGGATVSIATTLGTLGAVKDNGDGTYTAQLTAPTTLGMATISATVGGQSIASKATVQFVVGAPSTALSTVEAGSGTLTADGTSQTPITVKLIDVQGHALTSGGATVSIATTLGTLGAVKDNGDGTYTAQLTAPTTLGSATISATMGGQAIASKAAVQFVVGAPSTALSTVEAGSGTLTADGTSQTPIIVKLIDAQGHALTSGGATVSIATTLGTLGAVKDNGDGTYTAQLTAPTTLGAATINATVGGQAIASKATVEFVVGAPSTALSTVEAGSAMLTADGTSQTPITVKLIDMQGHALTSGGATVVVTTTQGTLGAVKDNGDGTYTAQLTAPTTLGVATISATVGGQAIASKAAVQFVVGSPSTALSTVEAGSVMLTADGTSQTPITVKLIDAQGHTLTSGGAAVVVTTTLGTLGAVKDNGDGTYTAQLTAPTTLGTATINAAVGGQAIASKVTVEFVVGEVSPSRSTVIASDLVVRADGDATAWIYVRLKDAYDHPLSGQRVLLQADGGRSVIQDVYGATDEDGLTAFAVRNTAAERVTYTATAEANGRSLDQTVTITFTYDQPPRIELKADPVTPTFGSVTVSVTASVYGEDNRLATIKWAAGSQPLSYFDTQGEVIADHFVVQANGIYSVYVVDSAGNANVALIDVQNIVPLSSDANLAVWQLKDRGRDIPFRFDPAATNYKLEVSHVVQSVSMLLIQSNADAVIYLNGVQVPGNVLTKEWPLTTGVNAFEVRIQAQDGSDKRYVLTVIRLAESSNPEPSRPSSGNTTPSNSQTPDPSVKVRINGIAMSGIAVRQQQTDGVNAIDAILDMNAVKKVLAAQSASVKSEMAVSIEEEAERVVLRLPMEVIRALADKQVLLTLKTQLGQYRLPLAGFAAQEAAGTGDEQLLMTIQKRKAEAGLQAAAKQGGFRFMADPVQFTIELLNHGKRNERSINGVQSIIYLADGSVGSVSAIVAWDPLKSNGRPVPTRFIDVDGHAAAVIRGAAGGIFIPISRTPHLSDIQGHWAAPEIADMNRRMIVEGIDDGRFAPNAAVTRAELASLLTRALGLTANQEAAFRDVSKASWYNEAVAAVQANGIMNGPENGVFAPDRQVSRQEAIVTMVRALRLTEGSSPMNDAGIPQVDLSAYADSDRIGSWALDAIRIAIQKEWVKGSGQDLRPQEPLTRAEAAVLLHRMLQEAGWLD